MKESRSAAADQGAWAVGLPSRETQALPEFVAALPQDGVGRLALFDADGTLWRGDVADDFCRWMLTEHGMASEAAWAEYLAIYRDDHAAGCRHMLSLYAGVASATLQARVAEWWRTCSSRTWVPEVVETIHTLAERGYAVWIVTGSPTDVMGPLTAFLPVSRVVGMDFELDDDGVITGRLAGISCADAGKAQKVQALWAGGSIALSAGNGTLDAAMIALGEPVRWAVHPNADFEALAAARGWHILARPDDYAEEPKLA